MVGFDRPQVDDECPLVSARHDRCRAVEEPAPDRLGVSLDEDHRTGDPGSGDGARSRQGTALHDGGVDTGAFEHRSRSVFQ